MICIYVAAIKLAIRIILKHTEDLWEGLTKVANIYSIVSVQYRITWKDKEPYCCVFPVRTYIYLAIATIQYKGYIYGTTVL